MGKTRMHSSRMRTGRLLTVCRFRFLMECASQGGWASRGCASRGCVCFPGGVHPGGGIPACTEAHLPCEQNDRQVLKYYLGYNFVAAGNNRLMNSPWTCIPHPTWHIQVLPLDSHLSSLPTLQSLTNRSSVWLDKHLIWKRLLKLKV